MRDWLDSRPLIMGSVGPNGARKSTFGSFAMETVFSDPAGEKLRFLQEAAGSGYHVVLLFIGVAGPGTSEDRVAMRVLQGGHDVRAAKRQSAESLPVGCGL